mmetsp:Transcript_22108/g.63389  ORF Transcript_22108/g.63389 Transcript_22108/m.63389 type:complete len:484 (+) Transcript_22108:1945-3396(+)
MPSFSYSLQKLQILQFVLHLGRIKTRHGELGGKLMDPLSQAGNVGIVLQEGDEVLKLGAGLLLDLEGDLESLHEEGRDLLKVGLDELAGGESGSADADAAGGDGRSVAGDAVLVKGDGNSVAGLLELGSGNALGLEVPQDEVVLGTSGGDLHAHGGELVGEGTGILADLLGVDLELGSHDFLELGGDAGNLVLVGSALEGGEYGLVDLGLEAAVVLAEEDHAGPGAAEGLVGGGSNDVAVLEGAGLLAGGDEAGDVGHVHEEEGAVGVGNLTELLVVPVAGVGGSAADDHGGLEEGGVLLELLVVDDARLGMDAVGERLEVDRGGRDGLAGSLLLGVGVEAVSQVAARGQVEAHDTIMGPKQSRVDGEVGRRAGVRLHIDAPLLRVEAVRLEGARLAQGLDLIDDVIAAVVPSAGKALGVFVGQGRAEALHDGTGREVLRSDQLEAGPLAVLLLLDEVVHLGIVLLEGDEAREFLRADSQPSE